MSTWPRAGRSSWCSHFGQAGGWQLGPQLGLGHRWRANWLAAKRPSMLSIPSCGWSGPSGSALAAWGGWVMAGRALAPLGRITNTAETIANSEGAVALSKRLDIPASGDELSQLAVTFNGMLDRIEAAFDTQRRFVSDASHELRTPLTSVRGNVDVLLRQVRSGRPVGQDDLVDVLGVVQRESGRMSRLIEDLLALARSDADGQGDLLKRDPVDLEVVAREAVRTAEHLVTGQHLALDIAGPLTMVW